MLRLRSFQALTVLLLAASNADLPENETLMKTILIFRHGMRAPIKPFYLLNTLNEDAEHWPHGYGALVQNGKQQLYHLGQRLGHHYRNLVETGNYNASSDLKVVTTSVHRCFESAQHLLAGFFSLSSDWTWMEAVEKQPVPILYESPDRSRIIGNEKACPKYNELLQKTLPQPDDPEIQYFRNFVMNHATHLNITTVTDVLMFADYIKILEFMNLELPPWFTIEFKEKLDAFFVKSFNYLTESTEMIRLLSGPLIEDITIRFKEAIYEKPTNSKMFLYSGHDVSLHGLSKLLGFDIDFAPYFGSSMIFEVHKFSLTDYRIWILFSRDYSFDFVEVWRLPECEEFCPVGKFLQIVEKYFAKNWTSDCSLN